MLLTWTVAHSTRVTGFQKKVALKCSIIRPTNYFELGLFGLLALLRLHSSIQLNSEPDAGLKKRMAICIIISCIRLIVQSSCFSKLRNVNFYNKNKNKIKHLGTFQTEVTGIEYLIVSLPPPFYSYLGFAFAESGRAVIDR